MLSTILITGGGLLFGYFVGREIYLTYRIYTILRDAKMARFEITWESGAVTYRELRYKEERHLAMLSRVLTTVNMRQDGDSFFSDQVKSVKVVHRNWPNQEDNQE